MKLNNDFYKVLESSVSESGFQLTLKIDPDHIVYTGHFPGFPVTPGVIQLQIVHELLENHFGRKLKLEKMPQCKFLKVLNPVETSLLVVHIEYSNSDGLLMVKARGESGADTFFKLNSIYRFLPT